MLGMVADIAHRMTRLNPDLGIEVLEKTPGIVVIDELDLHLHPKWQYSISGGLTEEGATSSSCADNAL
jgi:predicted ATP-binding protein involved in virulence